MASTFDTKTGKFVDETKIDPSQPAVLFGRLWMDTGEGWDIVEKQWAFFKTEIATREVEEIRFQFVYLKEQLSLAIEMANRLGDIFELELPDIHCGVCIWGVSKPGEQVPFPPPLSDPRVVDMTEVFKSARDAT